MYMMNVDRPLKRCVLHYLGCEYVSARKGKQLGEMGPDGGWFRFGSYQEAQDFFRDKVKQYGIDRIKQCDACH